jgi:hypothetical protein
MAARPISIMPQPMRLNLGCSDAHVKGWLNVDLCEPADVIADLSAYQWPWIHSTVDEVKAWDIFEHLPNKIHTMNECHRVMKAGAKLDLFIPTTDGRGAFQDPTHVSFWTPNDLFYFCQEFVEWQRFHVAYGITARFKVVQQSHIEYPGRVWKLRAILEAVK